MDIALILRQPSQFLVGDHMRSTLEQRGLRAGDMPWWVQSDILITKARELIGIVLFANEADIESAKQLAAACDPMIATYISPDDAKRTPRYSSVVRNSAVLELRWGSAEPDEYEVAQLDEEWYYHSSESPEAKHPSAWIYTNIDRFLAAQHLTLASGLP